MITTALIGRPTSHSVSPELFSLYARNFNLEYSHIKLDVCSNNLKRAVFAMKTLGFKGFNVTLPYKTRIMGYLDYLDKEAIEVGAVNTVVNKNGKLYGYNTDSYGAIRSVKDHVSSLDLKKVVVFGSGGAARALVSGFLANNAVVTLVYREKSSLRTRSVLRDFKEQIDFTASSKRDNLVHLLSKADIVCNASSCGMFPDSDKSPVPYDLLKEASFLDPFVDKLFFDVIFNPYKTLFLKEAEKLGAKTQGGTEMMIYQGIKAFKLWTGYDVSGDLVNEAKETLKKRLLKWHEK